MGKMNENLWNLTLELRVVIKRKEDKKMLNREVRLLLDIPRRVC